MNEMKRINGYYSCVHTLYEARMLENNDLWDVLHHHTAHTSSSIVGQSVRTVSITWFATTTGPALRIMTVDWFVFCAAMSEDWQQDRGAVVVVSS